MADGSHADHLVKRDSVRTTDATETTLISYTPPNKTGHAFVRAIVGAMKDDDGGKSFVRMILGTAHISSGSADLKAYENMPDADFNTSGFSAKLDSSAGAIRLRVTGTASTSVRWHGRLEVDFTEEAFTPS